MGLNFKKINISKRKQAENMVYTVFDTLDPSGTNKKKYEKMFSSMSNTEFEKFCYELWEDDAKNFVLDIVEFEREINLEYVEKAADILGIPLEEYVIFPFIGNDGQPIVTKEKVPVSYIIYKRLEQMTQKKNSSSIHINERNAVTGQVTGDDKNGRSSDVENAAFITIGALKNAQEINGFRSDGLKRKKYAYHQITEKGYVELEDVEAQAGVSDRLMLTTIDALYLGMGIHTDLVDESLVLNKTLKEMI